MKKLCKVLSVSILMFVSVSVAQAQEPYKFGVGGVVGSMYGADAKWFFTPNLALQADLAVKIGVYPSFQRGAGSMGLFDFELNPNLFYQSSIKEWSAGRLDWLAGGGLSFGYVFGAFARGVAGTGFNLGKFGVNIGGGAEFTFSKIPLALQLDFRPGYGLLFDGNMTESFFDWSINASVRYYFGK